MEQVLSFVFILTFGLHESQPQINGKQICCDYLESQGTAIPNKRHGAKRQTVPLLPSRLHHASAPPNPTLHVNSTKVVTSIGRFLSSPAPPSVQKMEAGEEGKSNGKTARVLAATASSSSSNGAGSDLRTGSNRCKSEVIFPIYVRGSSRRNSISRTILDFAGDPIWKAVKSEAKSEAEKEPILSSFLYASVLSHDCFERVLAFVLANRLQNPTLLATQLMDIFDDVVMNDKAIRQSIRLDAQAFKDRDPACAQYSWALLYLKGYHSIQSYRIAHALWNRGRRVLALALQSRISEVFAVDIHPAAKIGEGILLDHGTGLVIGETAVVGNWVSLMQGVTLGGTGKEHGDRHPKIGQGALIGAGATILGNISVGEGAMIAAGSLVLKDLPPHSMAVGNPAKVVGYIEDEEPSLTMKHDAGKDYFEHVAVSFGETDNGNIKAEK